MIYHVVKPARWFLCFFILSGLLLTAGGIILAAWAVLPDAPPYCSTIPPRYAWPDAFDRVFFFDGETGKVARGVRKKHPTEMEVLRDGSWYYYDGQASQDSGGAIVAVVDAQHQEIRRLQVGSIDHTFLVGQQYLVRSNGIAFEAYDLTRDNPRPLRVWLPGTVISHGPIGLGQDAKIFVVSSTDAGTIAHIYEIEPAGIVLKTSWAIGIPGYINDNESGDSVIVLNQASDGLERRSFDTGEVLERYPLPADFDVKAVGASFGKYYISTVDTKGTTRHFHASTGKQLPLEEHTYLPKEIPGTSLGLFLTPDPADGRAFLVDQATNQVQWSFDIPRSTHCSAAITPSGEVWIASSRMGLTEYLLDIDSGVVVRRLQPFAWVPWSLAAVCLAAGAWCISWRSFVTKYQWSVWWKIYPLLIVVLGLMTFRMWFAFYATDFSRVPAAIGYAIVLASLQVAILWIWIGKGHIINRLVHLVAIFCILGMSLRILQTPLDHDRTVIPFVYCAIPAIGMLLTPLVVSKTRSYTHLRERSRSEAVREVFSIKILMALTAWVALLIAVYSTIMPSLAKTIFSWFGYETYAASAAVAMAATFTALCSHRLVHRSAATAALLILLALLIYIVNAAVMGTEPFNGHGTVRFRTIALGLTFSFTFWLVLQNHETAPNNANRVMARKWGQEHEVPDGSVTLLHRVGVRVPLR